MEETSTTTTEETTLAENNVEATKGDAAEANNAKQIKETPVADNISFLVVFNKQKLKISWSASDTIANLKAHLHDTTGVPPALQKLMFKGLVKDEQKLSEAGIVNGSKMMLVGSKLTDVILATTKASDKPSSSAEEEKPKKEPLSKQKPHAKIVDGGIPDDAMPAYKNGHENLPEVPLCGMVNKYGHKVRLTFKLESDQVWIGTKERTDKVNMTSIKQVVSEPIHGHEEYHMLALQRGPTEQSRYWIYWVPAQYVKGIKDLILGQWQLF
uniref:Ubiquitin domain-containing protein UBFD1-like n=1 Tax=Phallusia mammillata TaxID=59560 RepID=A0A6F9DVJ2_9ASCI|nr:ubiquitin domain-containing protein UBFD1-like [Phallusia mammillata]